MKQLEARLKDPACEYQRVNITKMLELYKGGFTLLPGTEVWLAQGEVFSSFEEAAAKGPPFMIEVCPGKNRSWITSLTPTRRNSMSSWSRMDTPFRIRCRFHRLVLKTQCKIYFN